MASQPTVTIEQWFTEGWDLYKQHPATFSLASFVGMLICIPLAFLFSAILRIIPFFFVDILQSAMVLLFTAPVYAGLYYMALKTMRGEEPRIPDIFEGFRRYWEVLLPWGLLCLIAFIVLSATAIGILVVPLLWTTAMLAFLLLIDKGQSVGAAFNTAFSTVFTFTRQDWQESLKNWGRFWLYGLVVGLVSCVGILGFFVGLFVTVPLAVCVQVIAYRDIFNPDAFFQQEGREPQQEYPFTPKAQNIGPISQIRDICNQILEQIGSASDEVKSLLEDSIETVDNVFAKADRLSQRLQEIDAYLKTTNMQTLQTEKNRNHGETGRGT